MKTLSLGKTGVEVSAFCLGAMYFGSRTDEETSYQILDGYVEAGGTFLDTANIYARWVSGYVGGESETLLGEWMRERKNRRQMFIASKVGFDYPGVERGLRAQQIVTECEKSLERLLDETDYKIIKKKRYAWTFSVDYWASRFENFSPPIFAFSQFLKRRALFRPAFKWNIKINFMDSFEWYLTKK